MNSKSPLLLFFLLFFLYGFSQEYKPQDTADYAQRSEFLAKYKVINESYIKTIKSQYPGNTGREMVKTYSQFQEKFQKEIKNRDYIFNSAYSVKMEDYFKKLRGHFPTDADQITILISRDNSPNAMCIQDGLFVVNMGLFNILDNEDQLIAILAHEWGHKLLKHTEKRLKKSIERQADSKSTVAEIALAKVNKTEKAFELFKNQMYESNTYRRKNELQADSLGYVIYKKTDLHKPEYINALRNMQKVDSLSPKVVTPETYRKYFTLPSKKFKEKWLQLEDFSGYNYGNYKEKLNKDSLSTHPEDEQRINFLKSTFTELATEQPTVQSSDKEFLSLKKRANLEQLPNYFHAEEFGAGIFLALYELQQGGDEIFYKTWLGKNFEKIYEARKNYNLNRYLDRVDPKNQSESYQLFLNFMWNLSLDDIKNIAEFYAPKQSELPLVVQAL